MALRLLVFDRAHVCVHDRLFVEMDAEERTQTMQLVMGACHTLTMLLGRMAPACSAGSRTPAPVLPAGLSSSVSMSTSRYTLFTAEAVTGWRVVLVVRIEAAGHGRAAAEALLAEVIVPAVVRNPMVDYGTAVSGVGIANERGSFDAVPGLRECTDAFLRGRHLLV